jgi:hypothetical protein
MLEGKLKFGHLIEWLTVKKADRAEGAVSIEF